LFSGTACASLQKSILTSMTRPVPVSKNQFWCRWHGLYQSPSINFVSRDSLWQFPRINFDFNHRACTSFRV
jgi:hypothetical protein